MPDEELEPRKITIQNIFIVAFIIGGLALLGTYVWTVGFEDEFVKNMVQMVFGALLIGLGAALDRLKLGRGEDDET